jgi:uncharacterized membrane protein
MFFGHLMGAGLFMLLGLSRIFWFVLLIAAVLFLINTVRGRSHTRTTTAYPYPTQGTPPQALSAMEILRQRYARGEIDGTTFDHMRERLEGSTAAQPQQEQAQAQEQIPQEEA